MRKPRPLPKTLEAARAEIDRLERRIRSDQKRVEELAREIGNLHSQHRLPAVGSRWIRSLDCGLRSGKRTEIAYEFVAYAHAEGVPMFVFAGKDEKGATYHAAVKLPTFYREFDPAPKARARKAAS